MQKCSRPRREAARIGDAFFLTGGIGNDVESTRHVAKPGTKAVTITWISGPGTIAGGLCPSVRTLGCLSGLRLEANRNGTVDRLHGRCGGYSERIGGAGVRRVDVR